jgi:predicted Zn-dependent protease
MTRRLAFLFAAALILLPQAARAQGSMPREIVRDDEIETDIKLLSAPVWEAAGIPPGRVGITLIQSDDLNAFVAVGMNIFIYTGLILKTETPEQLVGVVAHETGHIAGGHLVRTHAQLERSSRQALLGVVVGIVAAAATGNPGIGIGALGAGQELAQGSFLTHSRTQEAAADAAGMSFLDRSGISSRGIMEFLQTLEDQELLPASRQSSYRLTHPLTRDRVDAVEAHVASSPLADARMPPAAYDLHARMRAKLLGYTNPARALRVYADGTDIPSRYGRAVALYRRGDVPESLELLDGLIGEEPQNPYFHELKGQILFENSRIAESVPEFRRAAELAPNAPLIHLEFGHALLETHAESDLAEAVDTLRRALTLEPDLSFAHHLLAEAHGRQGHEGLARLDLAEEALLDADYGGAIQHGNRALALLEPGDPAAQRARDVVEAAERAREEQDR